ncbi:MAG: hypothetical protein ACMUIE_02550 [Thermoplasmatota archaeon]
MAGMMDRGGVLIRIGGALLTAAGIAAIVLSAELFQAFSWDPGGRLGEFLLRAGFGSLLMGLLILFLFSVRTVPRELSESFQVTQGRNMGRILTALNLEGNGYYIPPGGRSMEDRVYVPMEKRKMGLPDLPGEQVFNVGTTTPSMGVSIIPPGLDLVESVEESAGRRFGEDLLADGGESLERLGKGTGLFGSIDLRTEKENIRLNIKHRDLKETCDRLWEEYPSLHLQVGCPGCSAVLCATARMAHTPLRIGDAKRAGSTVEYRLERVRR